jgi:hypothetical protein
VPRIHPFTWRALGAIVLGGCGGGGGATGATVATTPQSQRSVQQAGTITVRGDFAPDQHGPYALHGRYRARFVQRGTGVDFATEVPFTAHLEQAAADGPGKTIKLFERAAATGSATVTADGRFDVVVDYGDSPYELVLTPARASP